MLGRAQLVHDTIDLEKKSERDQHAADNGDDIDLAALFRAQIEQHDDEEEQDHDCAGINQHLNHADEESVEHHEKRGQAEKGNDETERARDRVAIDDDGRTEDPSMSERRRYQKSKSRHRHEINS